MENKSLQELFVDAKAGDPEAKNILEEFGIEPERVKSAKAETMTTPEN